MKCLKCGQEFEGNFCPNCGAASQGSDNSLRDIFGNALDIKVIAGLYLSEAQIRKFLSLSTNYSSEVIDEWAHYIYEDVEGYDYPALKINLEKKRLESQYRNTTTPQRQTNQRRLQSTGMTIVVLVIVLWGCYMLFGRPLTKSPSHAVSGQPGNAPAVDVAPTPTPIAPISISAEDLWKAYDDNKVNADSLYKDELLAVSGTIIDIGQDLVTKAPCVSLDTGDSIGLYTVQCFFPKNGEQDDLIAALSDGDYITIYGTCEGTPILKVQLSKCYLP